MCKTLRALVVFFILISFQLYAQSVQLYTNLGDYKLENGSVIKNCKIGYRIFGQLNDNKSNAILFPTWFGGTTKGLISLIGPGKIADSTKYFIISVDALGDGVSSSPSNSDEQANGAFPHFNIRDMVNTQYLLVTKALKLNHLFAVMGGSMGGMQIFQWIVSYPGFMDKAVSWVGSPKLTSNDLLLWTAEKYAIEEGVKCDAPDEMIMKTVAAFQELNLFTPQYRVEHTTPEEFPIFMKNMTKSFSRIFNAYNWMSQLNAMINQNVSSPFGNDMKKTASRVKAKLLNIVSLHDHMVNPLPAIEFGKLINAETIKLDNDCGHLGPGCEMDKVNAAVNKFLEN